MNEERVGRCIENRLFFGQAKQFRDLVERGNDPGRDVQLFSREGPVVMVLAPLHKDVVVLTIIDSGVTVDLSVDSSMKRFLNFRSDGKFHVGHPHADEFVILVREHFLGSRFKNITTEAVRI